MTPIQYAGWAVEAAAETMKAMIEVRDVRVMADAPSAIAIGSGTASARGVSGPAAFMAETKIKVQSTPTAATRNTAQMHSMLIDSRPR